MQHAIRCSINIVYKTLYTRITRVQWYEHFLHSSVSLEVSVYAVNSEILFLEGGEFTLNQGEMQ